MGKYIDISGIFIRNKYIIKTVIRRFFICFAILIISFLVLFFGAVTIVCYGPSPSARDLFVTTVMETSAAKFLAKIYFSDNQISAILEKNSTIISDEVTDQNLIDIPTNAGVQKNIDPIQIFDVTGSTYKGKMMIVQDPSRVVIAVPPKLGADGSGIKIDQMVKNEGGIAGINAGGFIDTDGTGNGGQPFGIIIKNSQIIADTTKGRQCVVGLDKDNKLIVGSMTAQQCIDKNIRDAASFGPVFIVNGKRAQIVGTGGGLNPRTCIGQTQDGSVLLLTIDGRQASSLGATYEDCIEVLEQYGAVNAANLDGGSSTIMYYNGEIINVSSSVYGPRMLPSAFVVK